MSFRTKFWHIFISVFDWQKKTAKTKRNYKTISKYSGAKQNWKIFAGKRLEGFYGFRKKMFVYDFQDICLNFLLRIFRKSQLRFAKLIYNISMINVRLHIEGQ